jgi:hypothetical protein
MKHYTIYKTNGHIVSSGICQDETFGYGLDAEQSIIELQSSPISQYIKNGQVVDMPPKPDGEFEFDYKAETWHPNLQAQWSMVKSQRSQLLAASDWTQLPDVPLATKEAWATYRQALRDITNQPDPFTIQWPAQPE